MNGYFAGRTMYTAHAEQKRLVFALAALAAMFMTAASFLFISSRSEEQLSIKELTAVSEIQPKVAVLVPQHDIDPYTALEPQMFKTAERMSDAVEEGTVLTLEQIRGQFSRSQLFAGRPFFLEALTPNRTNNPVLRQIPRGFRAVSIRVDKISSVEGWSEPGALVDVSWITDLDGRRALIPLVQNVRVLSSEQRTDAHSGNGMAIPTTATLLAPSFEAHKIQFAASNGSLTLALRGNDDVAIGDVTVITGKTLFPSTSSARSSPECIGKISVEEKRYCVRSDGEFVLEVK